MEVAVLFGSLFVLIFASVPIGIAVGLATLITMVLFSNIPSLVITQNAFAGIDSFPLLAIPFFILAGALMSSGGISRRLLNFANALVGFVTGGLAMVTTLASMFFAAISGSAVATVSAIGSFMIPAMKEKGYDTGFSAAISASAGTIGIIIPPSIPFVIYGVVTGTSVGELFIGGVIPGILIAVALMVVCYFVAKREGYGGQGKWVGIRQVLVALNDAKWALLAPLIVLGGIYGGIFTPTEAAVVGVVYAAVIGYFVYRELTFQLVYDALLDTIIINGVTTFMVGLSVGFANYLSMKQIPGTICSSLLTLTDNKFLLLLLINAFLLLVGCLIDNIPACIILAPILLPVVTRLGIDPVHFGVFMTLNLAIGFVTPPYGPNIFVASAVAGIPMERMLRYLWPFILALVAVLLLTTYVPAVTMGLVNLIR